MRSRRSWAAILAGLVAAVTSALSILLTRQYIPQVWFWAVAGTITVLSIISFLVATGDRSSDSADVPARAGVMVRNENKAFFGSVNTVTNVSVERDPNQDSRDLDAQRDYLKWLRSTVRERLSQGLDVAVSEIYPGEHRLSLALMSRPLLIRRREVYPFGPTDREFAPGESVIDIFEQAHRSILLSGASGAGKTTWLLRLVQHYVAQALSERMESSPIPVWLSLRSFPESGQAIDEWLVSSLRSEAGVHPQLSREWLASGRLIIFLDGLGELERDRQMSCVDAINQFLEASPPHGIAVCGRDAESTPTSKLAVGAALEFRPLTRDAAGTFLRSLGTCAADLLTAFEGADQVRTLLSTPFMLCAAAIAWRSGPPRRPPDRPGTAPGQFEYNRYMILDGYVDQVLRRPVQAPEDVELQGRVKPRLAYIAQRMVANDWQEIWEIPQAALIARRWLRRTLQIGPPLTTGFCAAFALGFAAYVPLGRLPGFIVAGFVLTGYVALYVAVATQGLPKLSHMRETKISFDPALMLSRAALRRNVPLAALVLVATTAFVRSTDWNPQTSWQSVPAWNHVVFWICMVLAVLLAPAAILSGGLRASDEQSEIELASSVLHFDRRIVPQLVELVISMARAAIKWLLISYVIAFVLRFPVYWIAVTKYDQFLALPTGNGFVDRYVRIDGSSFFHSLFVEAPAGAALSRTFTWPLIVAGTVSLAIAIVVASFYVALAIEWMVTDYLLVRQQMIEPNFGGFLQYATQLSLLRMSGGGYEFSHAELREYFANGAVAYQQSRRTV